MRRGKLAMLLFMSTEVMFFTAILGAYVVLRFSNGLPWPTQSTMHVDVWLGLLNTIILLGSSLTLSIAIRSANRDAASSAKFWLLTTLILAVLFLVVKSFEYSEKIEHGIYPRANGGLIHDRADETYLSAVVREMRDEVQAAEQMEMDSTELARLYQLQSGIVDWTQFKVGRTSEIETRQTVIEAMAHQIKPMSSNSRLSEYLNAETNEVRNEQAKLHNQIKNAEASLKVEQAKIKELLPKRDSNDEEVLTQFRDASKEAERLTDSITSLQKELKPIDSRLEIAEREPSSGINDEFGLKLPMVITNGKSWTNTYYLLTGFHAVHLIAGVFVMLCWLFVRLGRNRIHLLENFSIYWHFVDLVWLAIFGIVYLS